jgi:hypothetical protein
MKTNGKTSQQDSTLPSIEDSNENTDVPSSDLNSKSTAASSSVVPSLIYLEDIHIFALANLLSRTIIVLSLEVYRNVQPIHIRGIYLPLLVDPKDCIKDPIVIAFHNFHFMPLIFGIDDTSYDTKNDKDSSIKSSEKYFHFENIDNLIYENLSDGVYSQIYKYDESFKFSKANLKRKEEKFYNILPLIHYNTLEVMKVHFLNEKEEKNSSKFIEKYLNTCHVNINIEELGLSYSDSKDQTADIMCCYLTKTSEKLKKNGLSIYLEFLNESIKNQKETASRNFSYEPPNYTNISRTRSDPKNESNLNGLLCKSIRCSKYAIENKNKFYGYCHECFKQNVLNTDEIDLPVADIKDEDKYSEKNLNNQNRNNIHLTEHKTMEFREKENQKNITQRIPSAKQREEINIPVTRNLYDKETIDHSTSDFIQTNRNQVIFFQIEYLLFIS